MTYSFFLALLTIVWVDLLLSGDNAVVIALVANQLPESQRKWGIIGGAAAAVLLRVVMSFAAAFLLHVPLLSAIGGVYLLRVAASLLVGGGDNAGSKAVTGLFTAVLTIGAADATMSLDNVLALAALAHGSVLLMVLGVLMSIPLVIAGAAVISLVIERFPILTWAGAALLGWVAGGIIASDPWTSGYLSYYPFAAAAAVCVVGYGLIKRFK